VYSRLHAVEVLGSPAWSGVRPLIFQVKSVCVLINWRRQFLQLSSIQHNVLYVLADALCLYKVLKLVSRIFRQLTKSTYRVIDVILLYISTLFAQLVRVWLLLASI